MGQKIVINIAQNSGYSRFITGQDGVPDINEKDDVVVFDYAVPADAPAGKNMKIQWAEHLSGGRERWLVVTADGAQVYKTKGQTGTLNMGVNTPHDPASNQFSVAPGAAVKVEVYQYDPATVPSHGSSWNDLRTMVFDCSNF